MKNLLTYLDFIVEVSAFTEQNYSIVVHSDAGDARQVASFPLSAKALANDLQTLEKALTRSTQATHAGLTSQEQAENQALQSFGRTLFDFLLPSEVRTLYYQCLSEAVHHDRGVRLKLSLQDPILAALPWEFLYDTRRRDFVCLDPHTPLVRYTELPQTTPPLAVEPPLQILGVIADPTDMPVRLDVAEEQRRINNAVRALEEQQLVKLTWLEGQTWRDLQRIMRAGDADWHIFHFIGHGGFDEQRNEGFIILADEQQLSHRLYASQLTRLLARQRNSLRLVLLNACEGARTGQQDLLSSTAATLVNSGVPAVLAMQYGITDSAAVEFANTFYESLADNLPVDAAVAEARNAINFRNARSLEWGVPVLHMRAPDGRLFSLADSTYAVTGHRTYVRSQAEEPPTSWPERIAPTRSASLPAAPAEDDLFAVLSAVQQQQRHLELYANPPEAAKPAPETLSPASTTDKGAAAAAQPTPPSAPTVNQLDISDLLQSYVQRHQSIIGFDWVTIPAGEFLMGSNPEHDIHLFEDELPQFRLYLPPFRIARVPVTNAQYKLFVDATGHRSPTHWTNGTIPSSREQYPIVNVSWRDAVAFCEWAGVRLPTEAEWEKAARGRDGRIYPWGDAPPNSERCNFDMKVGAPVAVGSYPVGASPYGILDMAGNIWEWTASIWLDSYENYVTQIENSSDNNLRRVLRGGGFRDVEFVRCAARSWDLPTQRYRDLGFRVVAID
ncbi:MAG: SUMF1/EgtB/PvdO family nonheme iron enzyme [Caldilineaceae bacterium]